MPRRRPLEPSPIRGVWLPIVTPFLDGELDLESYERLLGFYLNQGISGVIPLGTTGETPTVEPYEAEAIIDLTLEIVDRRIPVYVGIGGNSTRNVTQLIQRFGRFGFDGILSVCPYYNRPSEDGIREHFRRVAESTDRRILIYNIPYRTGVNLSNDSILELSQVSNIVGVKDCCASLPQTIDLLRRKPTGFAVMTGEDALFYATLALGGEGGILSSAHYQPKILVEVFERMADNDHQEARALWSSVESATRLFFREPNPMPMKHWLWRCGLIRSPECRLPLARISAALAEEIDMLPGLESSLMAGVS